MFNTRSCSKNYNETTSHNYNGLIDYFAVINPNKDVILMVPVEIAATGNMSICYEEVCKSNQNHYKDYLFDNLI